MQALKDAGIVLVVVLLATTVRFTPQEQPAEELGRASLTPQTHAAPKPASSEGTQFGFGEFAAPAEPVPAKIAVVAGPDETIHHWVVNATAEIEAQAVEQCTEILFQIRKAAKETHDEAVVRETEEVVRVLPCSA